MKKMVMVLALLMVVSAGAFAGPLGLNAAGLEWRANGFFNANNVELTLLWEPLNVCVGLSMGTWGMALDLSGDWWIYKGAIAGPLKYYVFPGVYGNMRLSSDAWMDFGVRFGAGLQFFVIDPLELFVEPALGVGLIHLGTGRTFFSIVPDFHLAAGFRFYF